MLLYPVPCQQVTVILYFHPYIVDLFLPEYAGNIGDAKDAEAREAEQNRVLQLVDKF